MLSFLQALILGSVQGITELFPVSSLGHSVLLPALFGWNIDQSSNIFLVFLVATHFATALVLFIFFFKDWILILKGIFRSIRNRAVNANDTYEKLGWLLICATIPAGVLGLLLQKKIQSLFGSAELVSIFLIANGMLLYGAEILRKRKDLSTEPDIDSRIAKISLLQSVKIGFAECCAYPRLFTHRLDLGRRAFYRPRPRSSRAIFLPSCNAGHLCRFHFEIT